MRKCFITLFSLVVPLTLSAQSRITVDAAKVEGTIPQLIYGAGAEDVNHEIYGGLYDQRIFGESFEEPALNRIIGFASYDNPWSVEGDVLRLDTDGFGKIVYNSRKLRKATVEVDMRIDGADAISGFIFNVSGAANGADAFNGYEISLDAGDRKLVVGKHENNWQPVTELPVEFSPAEWNRLRIDFDGAKVSVLINGEKIYDYQDTANPLTEGYVGLRSYNGPASFRNLMIDGKAVGLRNIPVGVSSMWTPVGSGAYEHDGTQAFNGTYSQKITGAAGDGICNLGLNKWGIGIVEAAPMSGYVYLKGNVDKAYVALQSADGSREYCRSEIGGIGQDWQRFDFEMTPSASDNNARFVVALDGEGTMWVDMAMLHTSSFPYRADLTQAFMNEKLTFLRYGGTMVNAPEYKVKNMMGPRDQRPPYKGHWYRYSTNGFGIIEFVAFARKIGTEPTFSINIEDNPQDVIALLEELKPYDLKYIEIGNEENIGDESLSAYEHYVERFLAFYNAIHPLYPELQFINAAWWRQDKPELMKYVFNSLDGKAALWDYHPWTDVIDQACAVETELKNMRQMFLDWNPKTSMKCAILEENGNTHNMHRALSHAIVLNAVRKMNGFVQLDSPANALQPYLQNDNGWDQGQIFFNSYMTWCQPPYYAQQMAASHHQPLLINSVSSNRDINMTATRSEDGRTVVLHIVNTSSNDISVDIDIKNAGNISNIRRVSLCGDLADANTPHEPEKIIPQETELQDMQMTLEAKSYTVLEVSCDVLDNVGIVTRNESQERVCHNISGQRVTGTQHGINDGGQKLII